MKKLIDKKRKHLIFILYIIVFTIIVLPTNSEAAADSLILIGQIYELPGDNHYDFRDAAEPIKLPDNEAAIGTLSALGKAKENGDLNGIPFITVKTGNLSLQYTINGGKLGLADEVWHIAEDNSKTVNEIKLKKKIGTGALIVQTSLDGENWVEDTVKCDVLSVNSELKDVFYTTKDVQLDNGCYYRVILAYKMEIKTGEKKLGFLTKAITEEKQIVEVYTFYCSSGDPTRSITDSYATPRKELGQKTLTKKDKGYDGSQDVDKSDPHFGWDLGTFIVNGYTRDTEDNGVPVFLKNVGDKVVLWFRLSQNINKLNGNSALSIAEDTNGYDKHFEVAGTNFKRGTLIIQYTDKYGKKHTPVVYSDFLAANTSTGADTRVQLFEEGDYEVSLDYEIKNNPRQVAGVSVVPTYTDYKIFFSFKIRNGNCMVYPFDAVTGNELTDQAWTGNGFQLDMARSRYLTIDVQKTVLTVSASGLVTEDIRFNRPAQDGESYTDEGIYVFTVKNLYTKAEPTTKTIYVGDNKYIRALTSNKLTIKALNEQIAAGAVILEDGTIVSPTPMPTEAPTAVPTDALDDIA